MQSTSQLHTNEETTLPTTEGLLAVTLALMTGHVQTCCGTHREAMVERIVSNLAALSADPMLSPGFKTLLWSLRGRWLNQAPTDPPAPLPATERHLWHTSPEVVQ